MPTMSITTVYGTINQNEYPEPLPKETVLEKGITDLAKKKASGISTMANLSLQNSKTKTKLSSNFVYYDRMGYGNSFFQRCRDSAIALI
jgi:hypothetical protein